ncbi:transposase insF [Escherichia coli]|nr:transposase insF [Escherichia coli]
MSAKGYCYDNACVESFFHSLKVECIHGERFSSREIMRATVFNYIECDYNRWRRHSAWAVSARNNLKTIISLRAVSTLRG